MRGFFSVAALALAALTFATSAIADIKITDQPYVQHDLTQDVTTTACSTNNRQQNEPSVAVSPTNPALMVAGSNDYCTVPTTGGTWAGFYYSSDGGGSWTNSLLPGYPTDDSAEGQASPLYRFVDNAGDPVQAWDNMGHLYYGGIGFNRQRPANGSIWVARYDWQAGPAPDYQYTTLADRGTPSPIFRGIFDDKVQLEVDRGIDSAFAGNVYMCYARFTGSGSNNGVFFLSSTDAARSFNRQKISEGVHGSQFCDIAVTRNGTVYVVWRQFEFQQQQTDAVMFVKSTDGGRHFTKPEVVNPFIPWDLGDQTVSPVENGQARYDACLAGDGTLGGCAGPEPRATARDCGDGPFACQSGYVFFRADSQTRVTADPTASGNPNAAYIVYEASVPGSQTPTGTTYGTLGSGTGTQASVYFVQTTTGGATWSAPARVDPQPEGHQFFPDIDANSGVLHVVYHDSRNDCATGPPGTAADFRTVPISHRWVAANPPGGIACGPGLDTFYTTRSAAGGAWSPALDVSSVTQMPQYEQFGDRDVPFHGDYNYISASGGTVLMSWTDQRDTVAGTDPRYPIDGMDGFDVFQTRLCSGTPPVCGPDTTPNSGGLDQNLYGFVD